MEPFSYSIRSGWYNRTETPAAIAAKFLKTLDAFGRIDPILENWHVFEVRDWEVFPVALTLKKITALVKTNVSGADFDDPDPDQGYWISGETSDIEGPGTLSFSATAGGKYAGETCFRVGAVDGPSDPELVTYPLFKQVLLAGIAIWPPVWANACAFSMGYGDAPLIPGAPLFPSSRFHLSWLGYLSAPLASGLDLPSDLLTERTPDGGVLMIAAEHRLDPRDPDDLRRSRAVTEAMIARAVDRQPGDRIA
jgi:hypothetical protein